jgi:hypothetical protein
MRPSLPEHRGLLEGERKSRFLHSAVACAPAPVGMTRLVCNGRCRPNAPVGAGPLAPHSRRKTWATTLGGRMGTSRLAPVYSPRGLRGPEGPLFHGKALHLRSFSAATEVMPFPFAAERNPQALKRV